MAAAVVVAATVAVIVVVAAIATVIVAAAMAIAMAGVEALAAKATVLSSAVPPQQCAANTTISLKRDARRRCQRQRQVTGKKQPCDKRMRRWHRMPVQ